MVEEIKYELTPEHEAQLEPWAQKWINNALLTAPMTTQEWLEVQEACQQLYIVSNVKPPPKERILLVESPISGAFAAGFAAVVWWVRKNQEEAKECFGFLPTEEDMSLAITEASKVSAKNNVFARGATERSARLAAASKATAGEFNPDLQPLVEFYIECAKSAYRMVNYGNNESGWVAFVSFFRHVVELPIDFSKWAHYETAALAGPRFTHEKFCIVSDRFSEVHTDTEHRLHNPTGPSIAWQDGRKLYHWRGTAIPSNWILAKDNVDPSAALTWRDIEQRRCLAEILGWDRIIEVMDCVVIDQDPDPQIGILLESRHPEHRGERFLKGECGTKRICILPVPPETPSALAAQAWIHSLDVGQYLVEVRT